MEEETEKRVVGCVTLCITLVFELLLLFIVFKCGMDAGDDYHRFAYPALGWTLGSVFSYVFGVSHASHNQ